MKKIYISFVIFLISIFFLSSCKNKNSNKLIVGMSIDYPPFAYYKDGKPTGFDVDLAMELGKKLNKDVEIKDLPFDTLLFSLSNKKIDIIISGMDITEERKKNVNFSDGYFSNEISILVKENDNSIKSVDDLKGKKIGTAVGTTSSNFVNTLKNVNNVNFNDSPTTILNLSSGKVDAIVEDKVVAYNLISTNKGIKILDIELEKSDMGIALNKENLDLLNKINIALSNMKKEGFLDKLIKKYIYK